MRDDSTGVRRALLAGLGLVVLGLVAMPLDPWASAALRGVRLGGDLRRELEALQQFGQGSSIVIGAALVWVLDPGRRRRLLDWAAAGGLTWLVVMGIKLSVGRPRPRMGEPFGFLWPWGTWDYGEPVGARHAWEVGSGISSDLWSMPSSHTAFAVVMAVFLVALYPRLRWFGVFMGCLVGVCRVWFGAHYPSDVLVGGGVALAISVVAVRGYWGVRGLDWMWTRLIDRRASPAWPGVVEGERARRGQTGLAAGTDADNRGRAGV